MNEFDTSSIGDENEIEKDADSSDANLDDGLEDVIKNLNNGKEGEESNVGYPKINVEDSQIAKEANASDLSCPPGFEHLKRESSRRYSNSFAKRQNKDIKGISFIHELSQLIVVRGSLGLDLRARGRSGGLISMWDLNNFVKGDIWCDGAFNIVKGRGKYIVFGDMNEVRNSQERYGSIFSCNEAEVFNTFINSTNLICLPMGDIRIMALDRVWSDHIPILLHCNKRDFGLIPFKVYHSWFNREGFDELINSELSNFYAMKALKTLDDKIEAGYASIEDRDSRIKLLHEIDKLVSFEAMDSIQKARIKWDVEGDENSKFFNNLINKKHRNNSINGVMHEGVWVTDPHQIKEVFLNFYKQKFQANDSLIDFPSNPTSSRLNDYDRSLLEANVSMDEIKVAV
ncbi:RNA-directed DNA polymerase, eukaryota, reverse transcriptase zinc-binding domain protein [Tanacetum coccineum]